MTTSTPPRWDVSNVYPGLESPEFKAANQKLTKMLDELESMFTSELAPLTAQSPAATLNAKISEFINRYNEALELADTIRAYVQAFITTDSFNQVAKRLESEFDQLSVRLQKLEVLSRGWIGRIAPALPAVVKQGGSAGEHAFFLQEAAEQSQYLMSEPEEMLAAEMNLSGAWGWYKLQGTVTSQLTIDFELDGKVQKLSSPALINMRSHPDETVRHRAYDAEMAAWETVKEPLAACMNGLKGAVNTLNQHRGRKDALHSALDAARIDRPTLDALLGAMKDSFPMFRKYFNAKAKRIGKEKLAWWDLFAPAGSVDTVYSFGEARDFVLENFGKFSPDLSNFARRAFDGGWIDAEQRPGKRGGAFCMGVAGKKESRILSNFDGSLDQVSTIAHELGHAFHNDCAYKANKTMLQQNTPMTLAETASIMCETIVVDAALKKASTRDEELAILETSLIGDSQVIVDIYSRFLFEKEVFERREKSELSAEDLCEIMENAQKATYGDGLDERYLHKYMWTWKPHYYYPDLSFYNFPYAFGLLFATGLYAIYQERGAAFVPDYKNLLAATGEAPAAELAARFGIDIRKQAFWDNSLKIISGRVDRYISL